MNMIFNVPCKICGITEVITVTKGDYVQYTNGYLVQNCFPYLTAAQREMLLSNICGSCYTKLFGSEEDEEEVNA